MLINLFKLGMFAFVILFSIVASYAQEFLPNGCTAVVIKDEIVSLSAQKYTFLFLHSLSENDVWLVHQVQGDGLQSNWSSKLSSGAWSALVLNKQAQDIKFSCIESKPGHEQRTSCKDVLAICEWPNAKIPENKKGVFFVAESMDLSSLTAYSERNGYAFS